MAGNASRIVVPQLARLWLAPVGTVAPDSPIVAMSTGWYDVGLFTPDSLEFSDSPTFEETRSHQSDYPTRKWQTETSASCAVDLQEWSVGNFKGVFGGGTFTEETAADSTTYYKFVPPSVGGRSEIAVCVEIVDGTKHYRRMIPRAQQEEGVTQSFNKTAASTLPLRLAVLGSDVTDPWWDLSDDPAMDPAAL